MCTLPLVSVVIPAYNYPDLLFNTIKSVISQSYKNFELLIVDDGSEVNITSAIESFQDSRIKYYRIKHQNANVARNYGIAKSKGKYIAMLDADDIWMETHIKDCLDSIKDSDGLYGGLIVKTNTTDQKSVIHVRELNKGESMVDYLLKTGYGAQTSTLFFTANSVKDVLFDPSLKRHQDYDFVIRYHQQYTLKPKKNITVNYMLTNKSVDFDSLIRFIKKNENDISPMVYNSYHLNMLRYARKYDAPSSIIKHYEKEAVKYIEYLSYRSYLSVKNPKARYEMIRCLFSYFYGILKLLYRH